MGSHVIVEAHRGAGLELVLGDPREMGQHAVDLGHGIVEPVHHGIDLGAQAGGQDDGLLQVPAVTEGTEHLVQVGVADGHRLEEREGGLLVLEPYDDDGHADPSWVG